MAVVSAGPGRGFRSPAQVLTRSVDRAWTVRAPAAALQSTRGSGPRHQLNVQVRPHFSEWGLLLVWGDVYRVIYRLGGTWPADLGVRWSRAGRRLPGVGGEERRELLRGGGAHAGEQVLVGVDGQKVAGG